MAAKTTLCDSNLLKLIFNATNWASLADNTATTPLTNLYVSLHTATPGVAGTQTTNEAAYTGYARVAVARTTGGWSVVSGVVSPVATITFPAATGGSETETFFGIGSLSSGAGALYYFGAISPTIAVANGTTPTLTTASTVTES
jgi:hypothetical protein